jgi:ATP-dependent DNA helicase RecG
LEYKQNQLSVGRKGIFTGTVSEYRNNLQLTHPDFALIEDDSEAEAEYGGSHLIPIYRASAKAPVWLIQEAVKTVLATLSPDAIADPIPVAIRQELGLVTRYQSFHDIHLPETWSQQQAAERRLRFEEAFILQTVLALRHSATAKLQAKPRPLLGSSQAEGSRLQQFDTGLPFTLTAGQLAIGEVISEELARDHPMQRLLVGEVGSGKTVVALRAMLQVIDAGGQAVFLAPTEILAQQHARTFVKLLGVRGKSGFSAPDDAVRVALLTGSQQTGAKREALLNAISGQADILVGTHALLEDRVEFFELGLVVVDEQQRFGVEQRERLRSKGVNPHLLVMTATPIPRTIAMTVFGDLDLSELKELPPGRSPIATHVVPMGNRKWVERAWQRVAEEVAAGHRVFVVCPRITENAGRADSQSSLSGSNQGRPIATVEGVLADLLATAVLAQSKIEAIHGQMSGSEKDDVMARFATGETQIIVATTVIEVGVNIPSATVMAIIDADRFGVSQLHQLRGRVGRGTAPGLCLLFTAADPDSPGGMRLQAVAQQTDGFALAQFDLEQRSEGDVLGTTQAGRNTSLKLLRVAQDGELIAQARLFAEKLVLEDPQLKQHLELAQAVAGMDEVRQSYLVRG